MFGTARHSNYILNDLMLVVLVLSTIYSLLLKILIQLFFSEVVGGLVITLSSFYRLSQSIETGGRSERAA